MFEWLERLVVRYASLDFGTANIVLCVDGHEVLMDEPSIVLFRNSASKGSQIVAVGNAARPLFGRSSGSLVAMRPMRDGVIADFEGAEALITYALSKCDVNRFLTRTRLVIGVPANATAVERRAISESALLAGVSRVYLVEEGVAAALGAELDLFDPTGSIVIDIGGGTTEITVFSSGSITCSSSLRVAGDLLDEAIVSLVRRRFSANISEVTAEKIKIALGAALIQDETDDGPFLEVVGRDLLTGRPRNLIIGKRAITEALQDPIQQILEGVQAAMDNTPPEILTDLALKGVIMTGGGALLQNMDKIVSSFIEMPVFVAENPLHCVARGLSKIACDIPKFSHLITDTTMTSRTFR